MLAALLTLTAAVCYGLGGAMHRAAMTRVFPELKLRQFLLRPHRVLWRAVRDRVWLIGYFVGLGGSICFLIAIWLGPLVVVQPMVNLQIAVAALAGCWLLGEELRALERLGIVCIVAGTALMSLGAGQGVGMAVPGVMAWPAIGGTVVAGGGILIFLRSRLAEDVTLPLVGGLCSGLAVVHRKAWLDLLMSWDWGWSQLLLSGTLLVAMAAVAVAAICGLTAMTRGRIGVISPMAAMAGNMVPVLTGWLAWGEGFAPERIAALALILAGGACFVAAGWQVPATANGLEPSSACGVGETS